jgi:hypothetical protein
MKQALILAAILLAALTVAVAQTKSVPTLAPTTHCICLADGNHHCSIIGLSPGTKLTCETVGGTWVDPAPQTATKVCITDKGFYPPEVAEKECLAKGEHGRMGEIHVTAMLSIPKTNTGASEIDSQTGRVVKLSDEEYARLQKLHQTVADEEKKIAAAHGVDFGQVYVPAPCIAYDMGCMAWDKTKEVQSRLADRYQFRGQWLFINVPSKP